MKCEICDEQTATMLVEGICNRVVNDVGDRVSPVQPIPSCDDCGPQLGYKVLASLTSVQCHG